MLHRHLTNLSRYSQVTEPFSIVARHTNSNGKVEGDDDFHEETMTNSNNYYPLMTYTEPRKSIESEASFSRKMRKLGWIAVSQFRSYTFNNVLIVLAGVLALLRIGVYPYEVVEMPRLKPMMDETGKITAHAEMICFILYPEEIDKRLVYFVIYISSKFPTVVVADAVEDVILRLTERFGVRVKFVFEGDFNPLTVFEARGKKSKPSTQPKLHVLEDVAGPRGGKNQSHSYNRDKNQLDPCVSNILVVEEVLDEHRKGQTDHNKAQHNVYKRKYYPELSAECEVYWESIE